MPRPADALTSPTLMGLVRAAAERLDPPAPTAGLSKREILEQVQARAGWPAVFEAGRAARGLTWHPVVRALVAGGDAKRALQRWLRLERFGHTRHRTQLLEARSDAGGAALLIRHISQDGRPIEVVNDLFIWGVITGLMEATGALGVEARLSGPEGLRLRADSVEALPAQTHRLHLRVGPRSAPSPAPPAPTGDLSERARALLAGDLLRSWTVADAARRLGLSARSLQRGLKREQTSFSKLLQRTRLDAARALLAETELSLTEIAFCAGFSDQPHLSRLFKRHFDVPPSELRALL